MYDLNECIRSLNVGLPDDIARLKAAGYYKEAIALHRFGCLGEDESQKQSVDDREWEACHGVADQNPPIVVGEHHRQHGDADECERATGGETDRCPCAEPAGHQCADEHGKKHAGADESDVGGVCAC